MAPFTEHLLSKPSMRGAIKRRPAFVTARHVYVRGHGPSGRYKGSYSEKTLKAWAQRISEWRSERRTVYVYFDNDQKSAAPKYAERLLLYLGGEREADIPEANAGRKKRSSARSHMSSTAK